MFKDMFEIGYEKDAQRNVTIGVRYVHEMLRLGYIPECYGQERLMKEYG